MKQSIALSMNPLVKVAVALIVGMALGRYALSVVPLWGWFAVAVLCLAVVFLSGKRRLLGSWALGGFGRWFAYGKC